MRPTIRILLRRRAAAAYWLILVGLTGVVVFSVLPREPAAQEDQFLPLLALSGLLLAVGAVLALTVRCPKCRKSVAALGSRLESRQIAACPHCKQDFDETMPL
jgi:hypothetical protein